MWYRVLTACVVGACIIGLSLVVVVIYIFSQGASIHQRNITRELAKWEQECRPITSRQEAVSKAEMIDYVQHYYAVGDGYRSTPEIEQALESQRQRTIAAFVRALQTYTGKDIGSDSAAWLEYLRAEHSR